MANITEPAPTGLSYATNIPFHFVVNAPTINDVVTVQIVISEAISVETVNRAGAAYLDVALENIKNHITWAAMFQMYKLDCVEHMFHLLGGSGTGGNQGNVYYMSHMVSVGNWIREIETNQFNYDQNMLPAVLMRAQPLILQNSYNGHGGSGTNTWAVPAAGNSWTTLFQNI